MLYAQLAFFPVAAVAASWVGMRAVGGAVCVDRAGRFIERQRGDEAHG